MPLTILLALAPCIAIGAMSVYAPLTNQDMNWGLAVILAFISVCGIYTTRSLYRDSRISIIFGPDGFQIAGVKKKAASFHAWNEIKQYRSFEDAFKRQYVVLSTDATESADDNHVIRNISKVLISDNLIGFRIDTSHDKGKILAMIHNSIKN